MMLGILNEKGQTEGLPLPARDRGLHWVGKLSTEALDSGGDGESLHELGGKNKEVQSQGTAG